tara:strand:+ start:1177 stop:1347 length:171 start_codon:yes stop_codon:yes gene_type:complete
MPGFKNVGGPRFIGAGLGEYNAKPKGKARPNQKKPKPQLPSWQDRNLMNRGTKLNP